MKKLISLMLTIIMVFSISCTAFAAETPKLTEEELWEQVANNAATVTNEVRPVSSFTQEEIEQSPDLQQIFNEIYKDVSRTIHNKTALGNLYTTTIVTDAGQTVIYRSYPKVTFSVVDVGTASSADIYSTFKVIETVNVDGDLNSGWNNAIRYKNVTGTMGCGVNTAFTDDVTLSGNSSGLPTGNIKGFINFVSNVAGFTTVSQILSAFDSVSYTGSRVSSRDITSEYVRVVGSKMDKEVLFSKDHSLTVQSSMSTINSTKTANQSTKAAAKWTFDVYFFVGSLSPAYSGESISINVDYKVNVK
jgi:hypothetical protein